MDGCFGGGLVHPFALEALHIDIGIGGDDDQISLLDLFVGQGVLGTHRALCLHFYLVPEGLCAALDAFGSHEGMGDAGGAGGHADDAQGFAGNGGLWRRVLRHRRYRHFFYIFQRCFDDRFGIADGFGGGGGIHGLASKAGHVDVNVRADDDHIGAIDFCFGELVLDPFGSLHFYDDVVSHDGRGLLQGFGCHLSVGDARRASGYCDYLSHFESPLDLLF
jgi:hypothetical protein